MKISYLIGITLYSTLIPAPPKKQTLPDVLHISASLVSRALPRPQVPASVILSLPSAENLKQIVRCSPKHQTFTPNFVESANYFKVGCPIVNTPAEYDNLIIACFCLHSQHRETDTPFASLCAVQIIVYSCKHV
jgi:hypothetical protein